jgi:Ca2+-binding EF-hand superfamily protein
MNYIAVSNIVGDVAFASFLLGTLFSFLTTGAIGFFFTNRQQKYQKLIRWTEHLINCKEQIVTVTDLVLKTELSPKECQKFLDKFVVQLDGEIKYTETGKLYYQFPTANNLKPSSNPNYEKLIRWTEHLLSYNSQIVTVADLVLKTELSPKECQEFLEQLVVELNGEVNYTEAGKVYYQLPTTKNLELLKLGGKN